MKKQVFVTREVFGEVLDSLASHFEVTANQEDTIFSGEALVQALADKEGVLTTMAERIETACRVRYTAKDELFRRADIVTIHIPYSREAHHAVGASEIVLMKKSAILIHAARGGVVDDAALVEALRKGAIAGAGLDVFEGEPALHPGFLERKNVVLSPHIASSSEKTRFKMARMAAENCVAALSSGNPPNLLNPGVREKG
jgi:glyoxylate/hydroxypyruvate/2-ketogluconate reductase